jgi:hypothetical protein
MDCALGFGAGIGLTSTSSGRKGRLTPEEQPSGRRCSRETASNWHEPEVVTEVDAMGSSHTTDTITGVGESSAEGS